MVDHVVYGVVDSRFQAEDLVKKLVESGIDPKQISFISRTGDEFQEFDKTPPSLGQARNWRTEQRLGVIGNMELSSSTGSREIHTKASECATAGLATGGIIGGTLGVLASIGLLTLPGLGAFRAGGPLMALLSGIGAGSTVGGILGALVGNGIPEYEAAYYEKLLLDGKLLLAIKTPPAESNAIKKMLESHGAYDVSISTNLLFAK